MPTRDEILREMGLAPRWVLRNVVHGESTTLADVPEEASSPPPRTDVPRRAEVVALKPAGERLARIAALGWDDLDADIASCTACGLCRTRRQAVPGVGDRNARWLFVGEGPGAEEDERGEPFVGQAGRLLDNMLAALGLARDEDVYIANVVKCRPPNNRTPEPAEAEACRPYLERQIALLRPSLVVALGRSAASLLLATDATIASLRGRVHRFGDIPLVVTYHPAYLLRTLPDKARAWEDLLLARRTLAAESRASPGQ